MKRLRYETGPLDPTDHRILAALADDARARTVDIARRVGLSAPSVAERIKRLEEAGVIRGYRADIDPVALGLAISAHIRYRPAPGRMREAAEAIAARDEIVSCDRVTGEDCFIALAHVASMPALERVIDALIPFGATTTSVVQSSPVPSRSVRPPAA